MGIKYKCPHCNGYLNWKEDVLFSVFGKDGNGGLIALHPDIGNYSASAFSGFCPEEGVALEFYCPVCHASLTSSYHQNLVKVIMIDDEDREFTILFSKKTGEQSTYKIIGESMEIFGDDSAEYIDYINLSMNY
jgi:hypothetical protein